MKPFQRASFEGKFCLIAGKHAKKLTVLSGRKFVLDSKRIRHYKVVMEKKLNRQYLYVVICACGLVASSLGIGANILGVFFSPLAESLQVGIADVSLSATLYTLFMAISAAMAVGLLKKTDIKPVTIVSTVFQVLTYVASAMSRSILMINILSAIRGFMAGLAGFVVATFILNNWFNRNNALVTGIAMCFSGISGALVSPALSSVIARYGCAHGFLFLAILTLLCNLPAILLPFSIEPGRLNAVAYGDRSVGGQQEADKHEFTILTIVLIVLTASLSAFATAFPQHFLNYAASINVVSAGTLMVSCCLLVNSLGKLLMGVLISRIGLQKSIGLYGFAVLSGILMLRFMRQPGLLVVAAMLLGLSYSLTTIALVSLTRSCFGPENYGKFYPRISLANTVTYALCTTLIGVIFDRSGSYDLALYIMAGTDVLVLATGMYLSRRG